MDSKKKVLIIGCGNIGALYDYKKDGIKTHIKAFTQNSGFETFVYDQNQMLAKEIADHYGISLLAHLEKLSKGNFDVIVISTPTSTHYDYLYSFLQLNIPVIVCEKPITDDLNHLALLQEQKAKSSSKVLVNYFRRFHPSYQQLKNLICEINEPLTNIQITYQRGFSNNATHALDLLYFLFGPSELKDVQISHVAFDEFKNDPTITLTGSFNTVPITIQGLQHVKYSFFELKFWFSNSMFSIERSGETIRFFTANENKEFNFYLPLIETPTAFEGVNAIENSMQYLVNSVMSFLENSTLEDNFASSIQINQQSLKIIESICHN